MGSDGLVGLNSLLCGQGLLRLELLRVELYGGEGRNERLESGHGGCGLADMVSQFVDGHRLVAI